MLRFAELESLGARVAAISDISDGDCRLRGDEGVESRRAYCAACGINPEHLTVGKQVHGDTIAVVCAEDRGRGWEGFHTGFPDTDGLITDQPGIPLAVSVADCVPLFLYDPKRRAIALVHAGREGTVKHIGQAALRAMQREYGVQPEDVHAVIGPSAGPSAYEVSQDMVDEFANLGLPVNGRVLNLWEANALQLATLGVPRDQITISGHCTLTGGRFHSHRLHNNGARNLALLML